MQDDTLATKLEGALTSAVSDLVNARPAEPLRFLARHLDRQASDHGEKEQGDLSNSQLLAKIDQLENALSSVEDDLRKSANSGRKSASPDIKKRRGTLALSRSQDEDLIFLKTVDKLRSSTADDEGMFDAIIRGFSQHDTVEEEDEGQADEEEGKHANTLPLGSVTAVRSEHPSMHHLPI